MTIGEVNREINSKIRLRKIEAQERAIYDYTLANLISKGVSIVLGDKSGYPSLEEAYPSLFDKQEKEEKIQSRKDELSAIRFRQFAHSYNERLKDKEVQTEINE